MEPKDQLERQAIERLDGKNPSIKDVADAVKVIYWRLWSKDDLDEIIADKHRELCEQCQLRTALQDMKRQVEQRSAEPDGSSEDEVRLTKLNIIMEVVKSPWLAWLIATIAVLTAYFTKMSLPGVGQ